MSFDQNAYQKADAAFEQIVAQSPEAGAITVNQLDALKLASRQVNRSRHPIGIRFTIPSFLRSFYIVFPSSRERRLAQRLQAEARDRRKKASLAALIIQLGGCLAIGYGLLQFALATSQRDTIHPTAIPWLQTQAACEQTERFWQEDKCWDAVQSPDF